MKMIVGFLKICDGALGNNISQQLKPAHSCYNKLCLKCGRGGGKLICVRVKNSVKLNKLEWEDDPSNSNSRLSTLSTV